jgi:hypothetical protein
VDSSAPLPTKRCASQEGKGGRDERASGGILPVAKSHGAENNATVDSTAGVHLEARPTEPKMPSGELKSKTKILAMRQYPLLQWKKSLGARFPGHPVSCPGFCASRPMAPPLLAPKWIIAFPTGSHETKPQCTYRGKETSANSWKGLARNPPRS